MNATDIGLMFEGLSDMTRNVLAKKLSAELIEVIKSLNLRHTQGETVEFCPPIPKIFECFRLTPYESVRVVLLGQDPYIKKDEAHGLSFSTLAAKCPPSLKNIFKATKQSPSTNNLTQWAEQGVLLLNAQLTTTLGKSDAHPEWNAYTDAIIRELSNDHPQLVFILLGSKAAAKKQFINPRHIILEWGHPSPLNQANLTDNPKNFMYCDVFERANNTLQPPIKWKIGSDDIIYMFTDGGCIGNGKANCSASYAYLIATKEEYLEYGAGQIRRHLTFPNSNNRGELTAFTEGLMKLQKYKDREIIIVSDSKYSIDSINLWYKKWVREGTLDDKKNTDLIGIAVDLVSKLQKVTFKHVPSHVPAPTDPHERFIWEGNEIVDDACNVVLMRPTQREGKFRIV